MSSPITKQHRNVQLHTISETNKSLANEQLDKTSTSPSILSANSNGAKDQNLIQTHESALNGYSPQKMDTQKSSKRLRINCRNLLKYRHKGKLPGQKEEECVEPRKFLTRRELLKLKRRINQSFDANNTLVHSDINRMQSAHTTACAFDGPIANMNISSYDEFSPNESTAKLMSENQRRRRTYQNASEVPDTKTLIRMANNFFTADAKPAWTESPYKHCVNKHGSQSSMHASNDGTTNISRENLSRHTNMMKFRNQVRQHTRSGCDAEFISQDLDDKFKKIINEQAEVERILNNSIIAKFSQDVTITPKRPMT